MQLTLSVVLSALAALVSVVVGAVAWQYRDTEGVPQLVAFNVGIFVWTAGNAAQHAAVTRGAKLFWVDVQYVGIALVPIALFAFVCQFAGRDRWSRGWRLAAVAAPLVALVALSWTNGWHHLLRTGGVRVVEQPGIFVDTMLVLDRSAGWGPAFWVGWLYSQALVFTMTALLLWSVFDRQDIFQRQTLAMVVGALVPWVGQMLFLTGISPFEPEVFFTISGMAFVYAVLRHQLLDLLPVARDSVLELMDDGVIVVDPDGRIVEVNDAATDILDAEAATLIGQQASAVFEGVPAFQNAYERGEKPETVSIERGGTTRYYDVDVSAFTGRWDDPGIVIVLHDVTPIRVRERELQQQNEQLEVVADTLSHDLRNPLSVASGFLEQARETGNEEAFDRVEQSHERIEEIIEEVLTLARHDHDIDPEPVSLSAVAREAWEHVETADATLEVADDERISADRGQLLTLLENLFRNAVEHGSTSNQSGTDDAVEHGPDDGTVSVGTTREGFYVEDDGPGIPPENRDQIFEHGFTTDARGSGFGLSIVERVASAHGWTVAAVEGTEGGARFEVSGVRRMPEVAP